MNYKIIIVVGFFIISLLSGYLGYEIGYEKGDIYQTSKCTEQLDKSSKIIYGQGYADGYFKATDESNSRWEQRAIKMTQEQWIYVQQTIKHPNSINQ